MFLLQNSKIYAWPKITLNDFKTVMDYSIFLNEEYVFDLDQKAKLYNKLSFFDPVQNVLVSCTNLNCNFYNNLITLHSILLCKKKLHCLAVDQSMYKKRNMFQQYNDTYFLIRSRKN